MTITDKVNMGLVTATAATVVWMFSTFASAADVERIEIRLLKQEIREIRRELRDIQPSDPMAEYLKKDLAEAIDELCLIKPDDRECK